MKQVTMYVQEDRAKELKSKTFQTPYKKRKRILIRGPKKFMTKEEKRQRQLAINRAAAQVSRKKKKQKMEHLEVTVKTLTDENLQLRAIVSTFLSTNNGSSLIKNTLQGILKQHNQQQNYMNGTYTKIDPRTVQQEAAVPRLKNTMLLGKSKANCSCDEQSKAIGLRKNSIENFLHFPDFNEGQPVIDSINDFKW